MKFNIVTRKFTPTDDILSYIEKKLSKLDKFFNEEPNARIVLGTVKDNEYIETQINVSGMIFRAEVEDSEMVAAIDKSVDIIERQIRKNKTRLAKKLREGVNKEFDFGTDALEDESEIKIVKTKTHQVKPMSAEEAVLQMNLIGHSFFVFRNAQTNTTDIVYRRKDGNYGLIETD